MEREKLKKKEEKKVKIFVVFADYLI